MKKIILTTLLAIGCYSALNAQTYNLTLDDCIEIAKERSAKFQHLVQDIKIADNNLQYSIRSLRSSVDLDFTFPSYTEYIREWRDSIGVVTYYPEKIMEYSGGISIIQPLPTDGRITLETGLNSYTEYYKEQDFRRGRFETSLTFRQPLHAFYGYNNIRSELKIARMEYERASKALKREEIDLVSEISEKYYSLLSNQRRVEIANMEMERQEEVYLMAKNKYEAGLIKEVDALQMEVDLASSINSYEESLLMHENNEREFKKLLGIELNAKIILDSDLSYDPILIDEEKAVRSALENRPELREQEISIERQKMAVRSQKAQGMIQTNIEGFFNRTGVSRDEMPINFGPSFRHAFNDYGNRGSNYGIGFTVKIPLLDWGRNRSAVRINEAYLEKSKINKEDKEREIETEVRNLVFKIYSYLRKLQLSEKNVAIAEKSFEITLMRFSDGDIDSEKLASDRNRLNSTYLSHLADYINYQNSLLLLMSSTLYDFRNDRAIE